MDYQRVKVLVKVWSYSGDRWSTFQYIERIVGMGYGVIEHGLFTAAMNQRFGSNGWVFYGNPVDFNVSLGEA